MPWPGHVYAQCRLHRTDSLVVTVTDNGTPPLSGTVTISVTVTPPLAVVWTTQRQRVWRVDNRSR